jgi:sporulation protein YlmC with PRC-barrel domain
MMKLASTVLLVALTATAASAQQPVPGTVPALSAQILTTIPANAVTVTHWYKQNVYDAGDNKIGEIMDVLADREGKIHALVVGVGGFLGVGEKDVAVAFNAVQFKIKDNNQWYAVMNTTKDAMKSAPGLKYDRTAMTWVPETTTGGPPAPASTPNPR